MIIIIVVININKYYLRPKVDIKYCRGRRDDSNGGLVVYLLQRQFHRHKMEY